MPSLPLLQSHPDYTLQVGSSGELHTSTHAMFVSEHRQRMAPLAQQDHDLEVGHLARQC